MNACRNTRFCKGSVHNPKNLALRIAMVFKAPLSFGCLAMRRTSKMGTLATNESSPLLRLRFFGRNTPKSRLSNLFTGFVSTNVVPIKARMTLPEMLFSGKAFKVIDTVVRLNPVDMMDMLTGVKRLQPALRYDAMSESFAPKHGVPIRSCGMKIGLKISENFSAVRNSIQMVKESVLDSVYLKANHVVPIGG